MPHPFGEFESAKSAQSAYGISSEIAPLKPEFTGNYLFYIV